MTMLLWSLVALSLALAGGALFVAYQLLQQNGRILLRLDELEQRPAAVAPAEEESGAYDFPAGLPMGSPAPEFELPDLFDGRRSLSSLRGRPVLLVFFNPRCGYCLEMLPRLAALPWEHHGSGLAPVVVTTGTVEENRKLVREHHLRGPVLLQEGMEVASAYAAVGTPTGYLVDAEGRIASDLAVGAEALLALAVPDAPPQRGNKPLSESRIPRDGLEPGTLAPAFRVPALTGGELALEEYADRPVLLVFSDPDCGPCLALAPELEARHRRGGPAQILMISRGTVEENKPKADEFGLTFPFGLQKRWEISQQYAMFGTPIAYLIGPDGRTAAEAAVGAEGILALYDRARTVLNGKAEAGKEVAQTA